MRMYADAVVNHMTGNGNDGDPDHRDGNCNYFPAKNSSADFPQDNLTGVAPFYTQGFCYKANQNTGLPRSQEVTLLCLLSVPYCLPLNSCPVDAAV